MSEQGHEDSSRPVSMRETVDTLRRELKAAVNVSDEDGLRFDVESVELELLLEVARGDAEEDEVELLVVDTRDKEKAERVGHYLNLKLRPVMVEKPDADLEDEPDDPISRELMGDSVPLMPA